MPQNALLIGISGPSSSGKTTLARLLREVFPNVFILHEDDFYKTDMEIPINSKGIQDWDCLEALNLPALEAALKTIKETGSSPPDFVSKEDKNSAGNVNVDINEVEDLKWKASGWMFQNVPPVCIIDGFLLYSEDMKAVRDLFDVKLFLRTDLRTTKQRREARSGYFTLEGFWEDPPGYVEDVVWPNYVKDHKFLFRGGDVEGDVDEQKLKELGIHAMPAEAQENTTARLKWAFELVQSSLLEFKETH